MKVAILGAGGLVGSEFVRQLSSAHTVLVFTHTEVDITDHKRVCEAILTYAPDLVINCAVLGVDACERDPNSAWAVNVAGAENLARAVAAVDGEMVQLSSNFVFDGRRHHDFYTCKDVPAPVNVYGRTKLASERAVRDVLDRSFIVRTSWVFGPGKANFFSTVPFALRAHRKVRAITDVWASTTYVKDLVSRIVEIVSAGRHTTYHVANDGLCSYYEFALECARLINTSDFDASELIERRTLLEMGLIAKRPSFTPMRCVVANEIGLAPLRDWRMAVAEYVRDAHSI